MIHLRAMAGSSAVGGLAAVFWRPPEVVKMDEWSPLTEAKVPLLPLLATTAMAILLAALYLRVCTRRPKNGHTNGHNKRAPPMSYAEAKKLELADMPGWRADPSGHGYIRLPPPPDGGAEKSMPYPRSTQYSLDAISAQHGKVRTAMRVLRRVLALLWLLAPVLCTLPQLRTRLRARWLRTLVATLERCGPVGIKWGQWASTRYDIFEDDLCDALGALTNAAPVHPLAWSRKVFRDEIGRELEDVFEDFSLHPIASGSIGQVHTATLRHEHGPTMPKGLKVKAAAA